MDFFNDVVQTFKRMNVRQFLSQTVQLGESWLEPDLELCTSLSVLSVTPLPAAGLIVTSALMIWKTLILVTGSESPVRRAGTAHVLDRSPRRQGVVVVFVAVRFKPAPLSVW